ncbi:MAG: NUDIX hydrolase [Patescibacteria group bacterium]
MTNKEQESWKEHSTGTSSVSIFLSDDQGRLLMVQDLNICGGKWSPIAGYIDDLDHEEPEAAAIREAKEELGLTVRLDKLLGVWHYYDNETHSANDTTEKKNKHMHLGYAYTGTIIDGTFQMQKEEIQNFGFFTEEQFNLLLSENIIKTPHYNAKGYEIWKNGVGHPLEVVQTKTRSLRSI